MLRRPEYRWLVDWSTSKQHTQQDYILAHTIFNISGMKKLISRIVFEEGMNSYCPLDGYYWYFESMALSSTIYCGCLLVMLCTLRDHGGGRT
jgi:hypothetical protein